MISLGKDLGQRASLTVTFKDHKHVMDGESFESGTFWGKFRARYGQKLRGSPIRLIRGVLGQALTGVTRGGQRLGPLVAFVVASSSLSLFGLGATFWAIVFGTVIARVLEDGGSEH